MNQATEFRPKELHTRFLYPFFFKQKSTIQATEELQKLVQDSSGQAKPVWEVIETPREFYRQETLDTVRDFLFAENGGEGRNRLCCHYLKVTESKVNSWFRKGIVVKEPKANGFRAVLVPGLGIELFLSPYGVGLLSIAFMTDAEWCGEVGFKLDDLKHFNYRLSQLSRKGMVPTLFIQDTRGNPTLKVGSSATTEQAGNEIATIPIAHAPFLDRLGKAGGEFTLVELLDYLLSPLKSAALEFKSAQEQFSVYTVVRFGKEVDFSQDAMRNRLGSLLSGLAQIEEPTHAGAVPGEKLDIVNHIMNTRHWAGVAFLGTAHLVADQDPPHPFDKQRVPTVREKYFIPYLVAFLQRLTLHRSIGEAAAMVRSSDRRQLSLSQEHQDQFHQLHTDLLDFTITGLFTEVSSREVLNRFYRMTQTGLGVDKAQELVNRAIQHYDVDRITSDLSGNVNTVTHIQRKIEWLEVFFVSFYAAELAHLISEGFFAPEFAHWSVLGWPIFAGLVALLVLQPWKVHHYRPKGRWGVIFEFKWILILFLLVVVAAGWFVYGYLVYPKSH